MWKWLKSIDCGILFRSAQVESDFFYALFFAALIIITNHTFLRSTWMQWPEVFRLVEVEEIHWKQFVSLTILHSCKSWTTLVFTGLHCMHVCACALVCVCVVCVCVSSPNTNDLYIHYMDKSTGTPSLEEKKALPNCANKDGNIIHVLKNGISTSVSTVLKYMKWLYPYVHVIGVWWWVFGSRSAFKVTPKTLMVLFVELGGINLYFQEHRHAA